MNELLSKATIKNKYGLRKKGVSHKLKAWRYVIGTAGITVILIAIAALAAKYGPDHQSISKIIEYTDKQAVNVSTQNNTHSKFAVDTDSLELADINDENERLVLQRDLQKKINIFAKKPFNLRHGDRCIITIDKKKITDKKCTNALIKRSIKLAIDKNQKEFDSLLEPNKLKAKVIVEL